MTLLNKKKQTNIKINDECQFGNFGDTLEPVKEGNFELLIIYLTKYPIKVREYTI
jgi:putative component of toxin-antitoxin plasmid stabilization module